MPWRLVLTADIVGAMDLVSRLEHIALPQSGYITRPQALAAGVTDWELQRARRAGVVLRRQRGVYALGNTLRPVDLGSITRSLRAVASHETAALAWGADVLEAPERLHLTVPRNRGRRATEVDGVRLHRSDLPDSDVVSAGGTERTAPLRTAVDIARSRPLLPALVVLDSMLRRCLVTPEELAGAVRDLPRGPGRRAATTAVSLSDGRSGSVFETRTRHLFWRHDLAPDDLQYEVRDPWSGRILHADMGWRKPRVLGECDGFLFHVDREPFRVDRRRANAFSRTRHWQLHFTWEDLDDEPYLVDLVRGMTMCDL